MDIHKGGADRNLAPRKQRQSKHSDLINKCFELQPGEWFDLPVSLDREILKEKVRILRVLDRYVRSQMPEYLYRLRITAKRQLRVSCHSRGERVRLDV